MEQNDKLFELATSIQEDCHKFVDAMISYFEKKDKRKLKALQNLDLINTFLYKKLADIELRLRELEKRTTISYN